MGKKVFANGMEIAHKAGGNKVLAAFPDVCMSPPSPPAGPVPLPYPDTSMAGDLKEGSKGVKIGGKPAALHGQSYYKSSPLGDEAATRTFGASVVTHQITGKTYFQASSMDVAFEGKKVNRHLDITTSNHGSQPGGTPPMPGMESMSMGGGGDSKPSPTYGQRRDMTAACAGGSGAPHSWQCNQDVCADCWNPPCVDNEKQIEDEYKESQAGSTEAEKAASGRAANNKKIASGAGDRDGLAFENSVVDALEKSPDHTIEAVGYKVHCTACHLRVELDVVTDKYVIEVKKSYKAFKMDQLVDNIIPAAKHCFPDKKVACITNAAEMARLQTGKLDNWGLPVTALKL